MRLILEKFIFPDMFEEEKFYGSILRTCYDSYYPFGILSKINFKTIDFEPITILYGGNGSGKSTALNVISEKLHLDRDTLYNRSNFFEEYLQYCQFKLCGHLGPESRIITSDDVFDFILNLRTINNGIDIKRENLFQDYLDDKFSGFQMKSLSDYDRLKKVNMARSKTQSQYVRRNLMNNVREHSNGESALLYFEDRIRENALYLLDEPENSLSPEKQFELLKFIEDSARFYGCQFVIATHSPFLLSINGAKIYDLDEEYVDVKKWTQLRNVRRYYEFFKEHEKEFN